MVNVKNAVEDIVIKEARLQREALRADVKQRIQLHEVAAYALNRLPTLYAATQNGWLEQCSRSRNELDLEIANAVRRGIHILQIGDPLHDTTPLPETEFNCNAKSLIKLREVLSKPNMRWSDVPPKVEAEIAKKGREETTISESTVLQEEKEEENRDLISLSRRTAIYNIKAYLQRSKLRTDSSKNLQESDWATQVKDLDRVKIELEELESHILKAQFGFSNVLEKIVLLVVQHSTQNLAPEMQSHINLSGIVAYTLNRLPAMYATSDRGYKYLRQRAQTDLSNEITTKLREGFLKVVSAPRPLLKPLPFEKFDREFDEALLEIRRILKRQDITCENVVEVIESELELQE